MNSKKKQSKILRASWFYSYLELQRAEIWLASERSPESLRNTAL